LSLPILDFRRASMAKTVPLVGYPLVTRSAVSTVVAFWKDANVSVPTQWQERGAGLFVFLYVIR
jgi:hypothetical protein